MKHVLYAEDDFTNRKLVKHFLQKHNIECELVSNGVDAFKYAKDKNYQLIILDQYMPGMNGIDIVKKLRQDGNNIPAIAITSDDSLIEELKHAGFNEVFIKPLHQTVYNEIVKTYLTEK
ncbi:MAG: response regulator [Spirochaetia bacterium]